MAEQMLGMAYTSLGRFNKAYDALTRAHNLLPLRATQQIAGVLRTFGILNLHQGRLEDSEAYQRRALANAEQTGIERDIAASRSQIGILHMERGNIGAALDDFYAVLAINKKQNNLIYQILDHRYLGLLYLLVLDFEHSLQHFDRAEALLQQTGQTDVLLQAYQGMVMVLSGRRAQGEALVKQAATHGHSSFYGQQRLQLVYIGTLCNTEQYVKAREMAMSFIQQPVSSTPLMKARGLRWLGRANHALGDVDALEKLSEALELEQTYGGREIWICAATLAECLDDPAEAVTYYRMAATYLRERIASLSNYPDVQRHLQSHEYVQHIFQRARDVNFHANAKARVEETKPFRDE
jgi:tetratricopeptide (TPR) repeat protein